MIKSLFKRSFSHFSGLMLGKVLSTVLFIFLARVLLPEKFGFFLLFVTVAQLVTLLSDFGLKQWYQKQAHIFTRSKTFSLVIEARLLAGVIGGLILLIALLVLKPFSVGLSVLLYCLLVTEALISIAEGYHLEMGKAIKVGLRSPSVMLIFGLGFFFSGMSTSTDVIISLWFLGSLATSLWFFPWNEIGNFKGFNLMRGFNTLKESSSYALLTSASLAYARGDQLVIERSLGSAGLGLYGAAYRYLDAVSLLPSALTQNLFPVAAKKGSVSLKQLMKITSVMILLGGLFSIALYFMSHFMVVGLLGSAYLPAVAVMQIFSLVLFLFFINAPLATVVQSSSYVKSFLPFGILNTITNVALNIILVPVFGIAISAWIMVLTELTGLLINLFFVTRVYNE